MNDRKRGGGRGQFESLVLGGRCGALCEELGGEEPGVLGSLSRVPRGAQVSSPPSPESPSPTRRPIGVPHGFL